MGMVLWMVSPASERWLQMQAEPLLRMVWLGGIVSAGALVYFCVLWLMGFRLRDFKRTG